jgi:TolB-like protein/AraC-like DNA-binding protein
MSSNSFEKKFIEEAEAIILDKMSQEQFGVSELAALMNMSRSSLLRKIKKQSNLSASQFIRKIRLQRSMEMLESTDLTISEISYQVGFGNSSYFIKCFREDFGFSPGEVRKRGFDKEVTDEITPSEVPEKGSSSFFNQYRWPLIGAATLIIGLFAILQTYSSNSKIETANIKKSIAVLPFKNMSSDSSNLYFVNGLMESSLNNLQKIEDLRVISRTSVEKYRNTDKNTKEIAEDLKVRYLVEGSGQRVGDQVLLNIQLIDALQDIPIWSQQYKQEVVDIFSLQNEIATKVTAAIEAKVRPAELEQIDKIPTENLLAYDFYLQAQEASKEETQEGQQEAIRLYEKAIEEDEQFSLSYAQVAIAYYYLDFNLADKQYTDVINNNADKALLYDSKSAESLIAKALYYMNIGDYALAVPHLEKALEYNPNSSTVIQILSTIYSYPIPNTSKYLKYALKGIKLDLAANDSISKSFIYLQLSNALIQTGFVDEAEEYINLCLDYNPNNEFGPILKIFIQYAQDLDIENAKRMLVREWKRDTTRMDILQEAAKFYYFQEQYDSAYFYYKKYVSVKEQYNLDIYPQEDLKIGLVYEKMGLSNKAKAFFDSYALYCENDKSIYQPASMSLKYVHEGKIELAIDQLRAFSTKNNVQYWLLLFHEKDPLIKSLKKHPQYNSIMEKIKTNFWENQAQLKKTLKELVLI